jgi:glutamate-1-semialdehyde 2,1-aminomutase
MPGGVPMSWMTGLYRFPPIFAAGGYRSSFFDVDGNGYIDFNVADLSMTMGYGPAAIVEAVAHAVQGGAHFLLPTEDAVIVAENLAARVGIPHWQFTLSASGANAEVIRIARVITGRQKILVFGGHYHGHLDETLVVRAPAGGSVAELMGTAAGSAGNTIVAPFNDLDAVEASLAGGDVALVLTEPALTNCTLVKPERGFLTGLRELTNRRGTLLCYDEAHTFQFAYGGLVGEWGLATDFVVLGKGLGSGISFALYGMSEAIAAEFVRHSDIDIGPKGIATGGTMYGSAVAAAAARAALEQLLTRDAYARLATFGGRLADGLERVFQDRGLPWRAHRLGPRAGFCLMPEFPKTGAQACASIVPEFIDTRRLYMANRGLWDAVASAGPQASLAHCAEEIDRYVATAGDFLAEIAKI